MSKLTPASMSAADRLLAALQNLSGCERTPGALFAGRAPALSVGIAMSGLLLGTQAFAVDYTIKNANGPVLDWNTVDNWTPTGVPGGTTADNAIVSGNFGGSAQTVNLSANMTNPLVGLTLGDTNSTPGATTVGSTNGTLSFSASGAFINSAGASGAVNTVSAPISLAGSLVIGTSSAPTSAANNTLTISGKIAPTAAGTRNLDNLSMRTVTFGGIDISAGNTTGTLTVRAGSTSAATSVGSNIVLGGTIANGSSVAANLVLGARYAVVTNGSYNGSYIQIDGNNTYTGTTTLGTQGNSNPLYRINSDQPFGPANGGTLTIGSNAAANTLEAVGQDRIIAKNTVSLNRPIVFQGDYSMSIPATTLTMSNSPTNTPAVGISSFIHNNISAAGKSVTIGSAGGNIYLANGASDLYRMRDVNGVGTTIISSNIADNSGTVPADSRMVIQQSGSGTLILTGNNTYQGSTRITGNGTIQLGNGVVAGSIIAPAHDTDLTKAGIDAVPIVNGTGTGTFAFNRPDALSTALTASGSIGLTQKGAGTVTLSNAQFNSGTNSIGDGVSASTLVVQGGRIDAVTTTGANVATVGSGQLALTTITLSGGATAASLNLKVGQPVYVTGTPSAVAYVDAITSNTTIRVGGLQTSSTVGPLAAVTNVSLTFGEGSALGTAAAITNVNNLGTLAGSGVIAGQVNALAGSILSPGVNDGDVATLSTGALNISNATLDFDLAATAAGQSDWINASGAVNFSGLTFRFDAVTAGVLDGASPYNLVSGTSFVGDVGLIATTFGSGLQGLYTPTYSVVGNNLTVAFSAIPEPSGVAALAGMAALGGCFVRRRRRA